MGILCRRLAGIEILRYNAWGDIFSFACGNYVGSVRIGIWGSAFGIFRDGAKEACNAKIHSKTSQGFSKEEIPLKNS